jgi:hypothetical protein
MADRPDLSGVQGVDESRQSGRTGRHLWRVGGDTVELSPDGAGWAARVRRAAWGGTPLVIDGHFDAEAQALAWCRRMAQVLAEDLEEDGRAGLSPAPSLTRVRKGSSR